jgi:transposase-like protein
LVVISRSCSGFCRGFRHYRDNDGEHETASPCGSDSRSRALLSDLVDRGLDPEQAILFVIDGGKALRRAIKDVFGEHALVHRCHRHKERNVCDLLPERDRPAVRARIRGAWALSDPELAEQRLELLALRTRPDLARRRRLAA